ncbi:unnamed protein product, partial [Ectocarpus sp. 4 AP-2014]
MRYVSFEHKRYKMCTFCGARTWKEESTNCCSSGKYVVPRLTPLPEDVLRVFGNAAFLKKQRTYNNIFSFTCLGTAHGT